MMPLNVDGVCMVCKATPSEDSTLTCTTCATPWHVACLSVVPETLGLALSFECPDCSGGGDDGVGVVAGLGGELVAKRRQELLSGKGKAKIEEEEEEGGEEGEDYDVLKVLHDSFKCCFRMQLPERPVTTPCGHNFCLKCFEKWIRQGKNTCAKCRSQIPTAMAARPRLNLAVVDSIRLAKMSRSITSGSCQTAFYLTQNLN